MSLLRPFFTHPFLMGGLVLGGSLLAWDAWGRSPGEKAYVGSVVRVDAKDVSVSPALSTLFPTGFAPGTFAYVLVTAFRDALGSADGITGRLVRVQFPDRAVELKNTQVMVSTHRGAVLPLAYGAQPVPVSVI